MIEAIKKKWRRFLRRRAERRERRERHPSSPGLWALGEWPVIAAITTRWHRFLRRREERRERRERRPFGRGLVVIGAVYGGIRHWLHTREWKRLLHGLPAVLVATSVAAIAGYESSGWDKQSLEVYRRLAYQALDKPDVSAAQVYVRKLEQLTGESPETRYSSARLAELKGEHERARRLMHDLAPADDSGHPGAHFWVAMEMLRNSKGKGADEDVERLMHHLNVAIHSDRDRQAAHLLLADTARSRNNWKEVAGHLEAVVLERPDARLPLAVAYSKMGDIFRSRQQRERAVDYFGRLSEVRPNDSYVIVLWARAVSLGENFSEGERILVEAVVKRRREDTRESAAATVALLSALADHYIDWMDALEQNPPVDRKEQYKLLLRAFAVAPHNVRSLRRLAEIVDQVAAENEVSIASLKEMLLDIEVWPLVRVILATSAAHRADWDEAQKQLVLSRIRMPHLPVLLNNFAQVLASPDTSQLEKALSVATMAARLEPSRPEILETRGIILAGLQRWQEALADLEIAASAFPDHANVHDALALVHQHLNNSEMASKHHALAEAARQKLGEAERSSAVTATSPAAKTK